MLSIEKRQDKSEHEKAIDGGMPDGQPGATRRPKPHDYRFKASTLAQNTVFKDCRKEAVGKT